MAINNMVIGNRLPFYLVCFVCVVFSVQQVRHTMVTPMFSIERDISRPSREEHAIEKVEVRDIHSQVNGVDLDHGNYTIANPTTTSSHTSNHTTNHALPTPIPPWCPSYPDDTPVIDQLTVATTNAAATSNSSQTNHNRTPKILCFIMTHSGNHATRTKTAVNTWGKRCDKFIVASNLTDPSINAIKMETDAKYADLWLKLQETMTFIYKEYGDEYDWFIKADDDSYYIMENLREFLSSPQVQQHDIQRTPLIYGHLFGYDFKSAKVSMIFANTTVSQATPMHTDVSNDTNFLVYASGGAGYVMNRKYVKSFVNVIRKHSHEMYHNGKPEDTAQAAVMYYYRGVRPQSSRNEFGQERFHFANPITSPWPLSSYNSDIWYIKYHAKVGGMKDGLECCPPSSIAFHYVKPDLMQYMEYKLYSDSKNGTLCRERPEELPAYLHQKRVICTNGTRAVQFPNITLANVAARSAKKPSCWDTDEIVYSPTQSDKWGWLCCGIHNTSTDDEGNVTEAYRANDHWNIYRRPKLAFHEFRPSVRNIHQLGSFATVDECRQAVLIDPVCVAGENSDFVWNDDAKTCQCSSERLTSLDHDDKQQQQQHHHYVDSLHSHVFRK